jgi:ribosomal protein L3 glutamine methyltransferase
MPRPNEYPDTVGAFIDWAAALLQQAKVFCGHGTASARDEAASLIYNVCALNHDDEQSYARRVGKRELEQATDLLARRIESRIPMAYLLREAWFAGLKFYVDERVLVPRSPFAELIQSQFEPWIGAARISRILELGTGSGCIAVACARVFPDCTLVATDISADALDVARLNVRQYELDGRIELLQDDLFDGVAGRFDLVISNPPYVPQGDIATLPAEYAHEPVLALAGGPDGMESARRILQDARRYLTDDGTLALEVGAGWPALEAMFPRLPFIWPELESGGEGIALLKAAALERRQ